MRERQFSGHNRAQAAQSRLTVFNGVVAAFAAIAGIGFTAWQTFAPSAPPAPQPINVTVAAPAAPEKETVAPKADAAESFIIPASFTAALNDGSEARYAFSAAFDGDPATAITILPDDREINVLAGFAGATTVTGIEYIPPAQGAARATSADVMILPEGRIEASGREVYSFTLQTTPGSQTLKLPVAERGKAIWIRVAGPEGAAVQVGEFKVLTKN